MTYNITFLDSVNNLYDLANGVNALSGAYLVAGIFIIIVGVAVYYITNRYSVFPALLSSSFSMLVLSVIFFFLEMVPKEYMIIPIVLFLFSIGAIFFNR